MPQAKMVSIGSSPSLEYIIGEKKGYHLGSL